MDTVTRTTLERKKDQYCAFDSLRITFWLSPVWKNVDLEEVTKVENGWFIIPGGVVFQKKVGDQWLPSI